MSLNEMAVDLTCDPEDFSPATTHASDDDEYPELDVSPLPGRFVFPPAPLPKPKPNNISPADSIPNPNSTGGLPSSNADSTPFPRHHVHSGMLRMARAMGDVGRPVQLAVKEALFNNLGYGESPRVLHSWQVF